MINKTTCGKLGHRWNITSFKCKLFSIGNIFNGEVKSDEELCIIERCVRCERFEIDYQNQYSRFDI